MFNDYDIGKRLIGQIWCPSVYLLLERLVQSAHRGNCVFKRVVGDYEHQKTPRGQFTLIGFDLYHWPDLTKMKDALHVSWLIKNDEAILPFEKNWPCGKTQKRWPNTQKFRKWWITKVFIFKEQELACFPGSERKTNFRILYLIQFLFCMCVFNLPKPNWLIFFV